jgi:endo-1,4-beta-xylanase
MHLRANVSGSQANPVLLCHGIGEPCCGDGDDRQAKPHADASIRCHQRARAMQLFVVYEDDAVYAWAGPDPEAFWERAELADRGELPYDASAPDRPGQNPEWLEPSLADANKAEKILHEHISRVVAKTAPVIRNWDVVNEAVDGDPRRADGLSDTLWLRALGPGYVALAFRMAHEADPGLTLVYNDYGTEWGNAEGDRKRRCILRLLEKCVADKVPVHALGLQSHLETQRPLGGRSFMFFLRDVRSLGLKVFITELDLHIAGRSGRSDDKIREAQGYVRRYLDLVQDDGEVSMLLTWGLSDRHTWLAMRYESVRGALPLDSDFNRGPLWTALAEAWLEE